MIIKVDCSEAISKDPKYCEVFEQDIECMWSSRDDFYCNYYLSVLQSDHTEQPIRLEICKKDNDEKTSERDNN